MNFDQPAKPRHCTPGCPSVLVAQSLYRPHIAAASMENRNDHLAPERRSETPSKHPHIPAMHATSALSITVLLSRCHSRRRRWIKHQPHVPVAAEDQQHILATLKAINWARKQGHAPLVARVRHLNDKKKPITGGRAKANPSMNFGFWPSRQIVHCSVCGCNLVTPRLSAATDAAAPAAWRSSPPSAAPRRASADLVAERCDAAICPELGEKRKCAACA